MSVVEDEGFRRLLEYLEPRYCLSSCKYVSETGIQFIINSTKYRISIGYQQIHKAQASASGLKKVDPYCKVFVLPTSVKLDQYFLF